MIAPVAEPDLSTVRNLEDLLGQLGGVAPSRVRIRPAPGTATEADLVAVNARKQGVCELIDGVLVEKAMGIWASTLAGSIHALLRPFVMARNLGFVTGADGMMRLAPGMVRVPDVAFISWDRTPARCVPDVMMSDLAPDLAVEVLSPFNTRAEMARKRREYFDAGVRLVWEFDPVERSVSVYDGPEGSTVIDASGTLDGGGAVLPGFVLPLGELFGELDRRADGSVARGFSSSSCS